MRAVLAALLVAATPLAAQETGVTIYSDGRVLVRRTLPAAVARGTSTIVADLGVRDVDPGSIVALDSSVQVRRTRIVAATGLDASLRRSLGREVTFRVSGPDSTTRLERGTLLSMDPPAVRIGGLVLYGFPGMPVFPDSLVQLQPRVELQVEAARAASGLRLMYMSNGLSWGASYAVVLPRGGSGQAGVSGAAQIQNNASISLSGVTVQLLTGDVRRSQGPRPMAMQARALEGGAVVAAEEEPAEEALGGTHVYTLPGTVDFAPGETRTVALFPRSTAAVEPEFVLRNQAFGVVNEWPDAQRDQHPEIGYRVRRPAASGFGATPLPSGVVRVYEPDSAGRAQLVGEAMIAHTPGGRDLRVTTGTAFDLSATRTQTYFERRGPREVISGYRVELQSAKAQAATVAVMDQCPGRCEVVSSTVTAEQPSAGTVSFRVPVPAGGSASLEYRLRARW